MKKFFIILKINIKKILLISFLFLIPIILFFPEHLLKLDKVNKLFKNLGFELNHIQVLGKSEFSVSPGWVLISKRKTFLLSDFKLIRKSTLAIPLQFNN